MKYTKHCIAKSAENLFKSIAKNAVFAFISIEKM